MTRRCAPARKRTCNPRGAGVRSVHAWARVSSVSCRNCRWRRCHNACKVCTEVSTNPRPLLMLFQNHFRSNLIQLHGMPKMMSKCKTKKIGCIQDTDVPEIKADYDIVQATCTSGRGPQELFCLSGSYLTYGSTTHETSCKQSSRI